MPCKFGLTGLSNFYRIYLINYATTESGITSPLLLLKTVTPAFSSQNAGVFSCPCTCFDKALICRNGFTKFPSMLALNSLVARPRVLQFLLEMIQILSSSITTTTAQKISLDFWVICKKLLSWSMTKTGRFCFLNNPSSAFLSDDICKLANIFRLSFNHAN